MAPYESDECGRLRAVLPARCPFASPGEASCRLAVHHRRQRTTGPCFPLDVVRCKSHPVHCFTLYPPGHFPYGRQALARCSVAGPLLLVDATTRQPQWDGTVLHAALRAASGERWPPHGATSLTPAVRRTQGRHLDLAARLLGVHPSLDDGQRERIATRLRVPTMTLRSAACRWVRSWTQRGAAIVLVLAALLVDGSLLDRLASAGYAAGLWALPRRWEPPRRWVVARRSADPEHPPQTQANSRAPPSTSSHGATAAEAGYGSRPP